MHVGRPQVQRGDIKHTADTARLALFGARLQAGWLLSSDYYPSATLERVRLDNDYVIDAAAADPGRLVAAVTVPARASWAADEVERTARRGARVLKLHSVGSGLDLRRGEDAALLEQRIAQAHRLGMAVLLHSNMTTREEAEALVALVERQRGGKIVLAHALTRHHQLLRSLSAAHVLVDVSGILAWPYFRAARGDAQASEASRRLAADLVESWRAFGIHRVLFASDWPIVHPADALRLLETLPLTAAERRAIVGQNAARAFPRLAACRPAGR
jgi:predicted TIM-barrel fold metal-dependent hydrolase